MDDFSKVDINEELEKKFKEEELKMEEIDDTNVITKAFK